jgi:hypothetical protein
MKTNPNDPATGHARFSAETGEFSYNEDGLTKREYFAAKALQGAAYVGAAPATAAKYAVECADALVAELSK